MKALYFSSQRRVHACVPVCVWRKVLVGGSYFGTGCYVRTLQTLETWYWPLTAEEVGKETLRLVSLLLST